VQSLKHAFRFISASFSLALKNTGLQEPWFYLGLGELAILFMWFLPLALVAGLIGLSPVGMVLIGLLSVFLLTSLLIWGEITALLTAQACWAITSEADPDAQPNLQKLKTHGLDILTLALTLPGLNLFQSIKQLFSPKDNQPDERAIWLEAHYLTLPVIAIERLNLSETVARVKQIVKDNLLRFRIDLIRVRLVANLVQILLLAGGIILAFVVGLNIADPQTAGPWRRILAAGISLLVAWIPIVIGVLFSSFTRTCYTTALYQWVRNVETTRNASETIKTSPPVILQQVLGTTTSSKKEREHAAKTGNAHLE
jgi:hypothetical protein